MASRAIVIAFCFAGLQTVSAQGPEAAGVRGESGGTRRQLAVAEQLLKSHKPGEARKLLAKILDESGDDLILVESGRYVAAQWYAQRLLARLPEDELKFFRAGIDDAANKLLEDGRSRREPEPLQELIERYYVSRAAAEALALLGELAFERGEFELAEHYWAWLLTEEDRPPGPIANLPTIAARRILAVCFQNDVERAGKLLQEFFKTHADARGRLAGRDGKLADILREELQIPRKPRSTVSSASDWPTLGGSAQRSGFVPGSLGQLPIAPLWSVPIPGRSEGGPVVNAVRRVGFHPILDRNHVYLADPHRIHRFNFADGKLHTIYVDAQKDRSNTPGQWQNADFTLTEAYGRVYGRLGEAGVLPGDANRKSAMASRIVGVPANSNLPPRIITPPVGDDAIAGWEGAPLAADGKLFAAFTRLDGGRLVQAIACYDDRNAKPLWVTDVCEAAVAEAESRERQELLSAAGPNVIFCSQSGVIAAVNRRTGKPAWSYRYQRIPKVPFDGRPRDLTPPVAAGSRVFVAPNDSDKLFAFDAESGRLLWQSGPILVDHLIGVADGKVIAAIAGPQRGLRAYHAANGSCDPPHGWMQHDDPMLATFGRGLIAGDLIAWPTQAGLYLIRLEDGLPARPLLRDVHGNLAYADGKLAVADAKTLSLFAWPVTGPAEPPTKVLTRADFNPKTKRRIISSFDFPTSYFPPDLSEPRLLKDHKVAVVAFHQTPKGECFLPPKGVWSVDEKGAILSSGRETGGQVYYSGRHMLTARNSLLEIRSRDQTQVSLDLQLPIRGVKPCAFDIIVVRLGEHVLAGLNQQLEVQWLLDSQKKFSIRPLRIHSAPQFDDHYYSANGLILARLSNGNCWVVDGQHGVVLAELPATAAWTSPPASLDFATIAFATGPGTVSAIDEFKKGIVWTYDVPNPAGLAGTAPQLREVTVKKTTTRSAIGARPQLGRLLVLFARNHGLELDCITRGKRCWEKPAFLGHGPASLSEGIFFKDMFILAMPNRIVAVNYETGDLVWENTLPPGSRWALHAFDDAIAVVPNNASFEFNNLASLLTRDPISQIADLLSRKPTSISLLDPKSGWLKHIIKNVPGPITTSTIQGGNLWLATPQTIYRVK